MQPTRGEHAKGWFFSFEVDGLRSDVGVGALAIAHDPFFGIRTQSLDASALASLGLRGSKHPTSEMIYLLPAGT